MNRLEASQLYQPCCILLNKMSPPPRSGSLYFSSDYDAIIICAGHNGLTCGYYLAKAGLEVLVLEEYHSIGGMTITEEITLPGFKSDVHAFGYQLANLSPVPDELNLGNYGFKLIYPDISFSHIFPNGRYVSMYQSVANAKNNCKIATKGI